MRFSLWTCTPEHLTSEHLTSKHLTPEHLTPEHLTSEHLTSEHLSSKHLTPEYLTSEHLELNRKLQDISAHLRLLPGHLGDLVASEPKKRKTSFSAFTFLISE